MLDNSLLVHYTALSRPGNAEMRLPLFAIIIWLSQFAFQALAIQKSLAGVVDWHKRLIGIPRGDLAPSFHRIPAINGSNVDQDVIVTVTDHNVLAVLDPVDGNISTWKRSTASTFTDSINPLQSGGRDWKVMMWLWN